MPYWGSHWSVKARHRREEAEQARLRHQGYVRPVAEQVPAPSADETTAMLTKVAPVDRETLYGEVWAEPMTAVAARYHVSSNFLARICERLKVPTPGRGYWAKVNAGQVQAKPSLPDALPGDELEWARQGVPRRAPSAPPKAPETRPKGEALPVVLSGAPHALVVAGASTSAALRSRMLAI